MKSSVRAGGVLILLLLAGCGTLSEEPDSRGRGLGQRVEPVSNPLDEGSRRTLDRAVEALSRGSYAQARELLAALDGDYDYESPVLLARARLERETGRQKNAMSHYETLLQVEPGHPVAANNLALLYREQGRIGDARELLSRALEESPKRPRLHYNSAVLHELYLMNLGKALEHYRRYQALTPEDDDKVARWIQDLKRRVNE